MVAVSEQTIEKTGRRYGFVTTTSGSLDATRFGGGKTTKGQWAYYTVKVLHVLLLIVLFALTISYLVPFVWMFLGAFKPNPELHRFPPTFFPEAWTTEQFGKVFEYIDFFRMFWNSVKVSVAQTVLAAYSSVLVGFVLAKYEFPGRSLCMTALLVSMMLPGIVLLVPAWYVKQSLGLLNKHLGLIIPWYSSFGIFMLRQFSFSIPNDLMDAARIDGANEIHLFHRIIFPLLMGPAAALGILTFIGSWNSILWPQIILHDVDKLTLPVGLANLNFSLYYPEYGIKLAGAALTAIPTLTAYIFASRYFIEGISLSGMKGA